MQTKIKISLWLILVAVLAISACSPTLPAPPASETPSSTPDLALTGLAQTAAAPTFTLTIEQTPTITNTPFPSITPIPSLTPIPSRTPVTPSGSNTPLASGGTPSGEYACELTSKSPINWKVFPPRHDFDGTWEIKNTGSQIWKAGGAVAMTFIDGAKLQKEKDLKSFNLVKDIEPGESVTLIIDMVAPKNDGAYVSNWGLMLNKNNDVFCKLSIRIKVIK